MKKLLLIALVILANTSYSQFSNKGCGWEFRSKNNASVSSITKEVIWRKGSIELYYNETCEKFLRLCYVDGSNDYYYPISESPMTNNKTNDGANYYTYRLRNSVTKDFITLQIIYYNPPIIRIHYKDDYIEFHE